LKRTTHAYRDPEWDSNPISGFEWKEIKLALAFTVIAISKNSENQSPNPLSTTDLPNAKQLH